MGNKLLGYLVDPGESVAMPVSVGSKLSDFYRLLHCESIDIVRRKIGNNYYSIVCDNYGLFTDETPKFCGFTSKGEPMLAGSLLILRSRYNDSELYPLTAEDVKNITQNIGQNVRFNKTTKSFESWPCVIIDY